jgi:hypothetical protein
VKLDTSTQYSLTHQSKYVDKNKKPQTKKSQNAHSHLNRNTYSTKGCYPIGGVNRDGDPYNFYSNPYGFHISKPRNSSSAHHPISNKALPLKRTQR